MRIATLVLVILVAFLIGHVMPNLVAAVVAFAPATAIPWLAYKAAKTGDDIRMSTVADLAVHMVCAVWVVLVFPPNGDMFLHTQVAIQLIGAYALNSVVRGISTGVLEMYVIMTSRSGEETAR